MGVPNTALVVPGKDGRLGTVVLLVEGKFVVPGTVGKVAELVVGVPTTALVDPGNEGRFGTVVALVEGELVVPGNEGRPDVLVSPGLVTGTPGVELPGLLVALLAVPGSRLAIANWI